MDQNFSLPLLRSTCLKQLGTWHLCFEPTYFSNDGILEHMTEGWCPPRTCALLDWLRAINGYTSVWLSVWALVFSVKTAYDVTKDKPTWTLASCLWEKSKPFWSWKRDNIYQVDTVTNTRSWNVLRKKETPGVLRTRHQTACPRKTKAVDDEHCQNCGENPKNSSPWPVITNSLHRAGVTITIYHSKMIWPGPEVLKRPQTITFPPPFFPVGMVVFLIKFCLVMCLNNSLWHICPSYVLPEGLQQAKVWRWLGTASSCFFFCVCLWVWSHGSNCLIGTKIWIVISVPAFHSSWTSLWSWKLGIEYFSCDWRCRSWNCPYFYVFCWGSNVLMPRVNWSFVEEFSLLGPDQLPHFWSLSCTASSGWKENMPKSFCNSSHDFIKFYFGRPTIPDCFVNLILKK